VEVEDDGRIMCAGGGGGGMKGRLDRGLECREVTLGCELEGDGPVERKRPSSSSMGVGGTVNFSLSNGLEGWESDPKLFLAEEADERLNMSSGSTGRVSRSESSSKSESGGTKDFLRRGDGVSVWELYLRKGREEGMEGGVRERWSCPCFCC
jgi:hypothetical protein